ncbi:MAG: hypothetical protein HY919_08295 [Elusimicrobia bacterium]|nr:hypothetical protein [Elusimicrobiota bacterium]
MSETRTVPVFSVFLKKFFDFGFTLKEFLAILMGCVLFMLSMPPYNFSFLVFFSLIPLLIILENKSIVLSLRLGLIAGFISYTISLFWLWSLFKTFSLTFFCIMAVFWGIFAMLFGTIQKFYNYQFALITAPFIWMAVEFFKAEQWRLKFGWLSLGYSQHNNQYFLSLAKYIGVYGISFIIVGITVIFIIFFKYKALKTRLTSLLILVVISLFSFYATHQKNSFNTLHKVQLYGVQVEDDFEKGIALTLNTPVKKNSIVVFPEYSLSDSPLQNPQLEKRIINFIEKINSYFIFGCMEFTPKAKKLFNNIALIYSSEGNLIGKFQKHHPIQFFVDGEPGKGYPVFKTDIGILGVGICYDFDYVDVARNLTKKGAEVLIAPTMDALNWGKTQHIQHACMMLFRAVETGRFLFRPASSGFSMVIDSDGNVIKSLGIGKVGIIDYEVPLVNTKTFYISYGYLLPYLSQVICFLILVIGLIIKTHQIRQ